MNRPYISLDEVTKNEFSITCIYLAGSIIQDAEKREGFDMNKNNYHLFTDNEKFILELFYILSDIENCLSSIENACVFVKRFYGKSYFEKCKINIIDYSLYHYDVLCYKISTLKDLYFKLHCCIFSHSSCRLRHSSSVLARVLNSSPSVWR